MPRAETVVPSVCPSALARASTRNAILPSAMVTLARSTVAPLNSRGSARLIRSWICGAVNTIVVGPNASHASPATMRTPSAPSAIHASRRLVMIDLLVLLERQAADHRGAAEFLPHPVDRALGERLAPSRLLERVAGIGLCGFDDFRDADADEAKACAVGFVRQQLAARREYFLRELGRIAEPAGARADLEIVALELERHGRAGKAAC